MTAEPASENEILALGPILHRLARSLGLDAGVTEDIVQETQTRLLANRHRLTATTLTAYAVVVTRNLAASAERDHQREIKYRHRLVDADTASPPDEDILRAEEHAAMQAALAALPRHEREMLTARDVEALPTAALAARTGSSPRALAVRLSRARARLRVEFLLAFRHVEPTTPRCRGILLAISLGDRRRQADLGAGRHLLTCSTCAALAEPLLHRRRGLAGVLPIAAVGSIARKLAGAAGRHPIHATATAVTVVGAATAAGLLATAPRHHEPQPPAVLSVAGREITPPLARALSRHVGERALARGARVLGVPADEGFWVASGRGARVYVQLRGVGESRQRVRVGDRVRFHGVVVANGPTFVDAGRGGNFTEDLRAEGAHLMVHYSDLRIR